MKIDENFRQSIVERSYKTAIEIACSYVSESESVDEKLFWFDYLIDSILDELCAAYVVEPLIHHPKFPFCSPFPRRYYDEKGKRHRIYVSKKAAVSLLKNKTSNKHSLALMFPHCTTDGCYWYNAHSGEKLGTVEDFRFAVVYTLAKMKNDVINCGDISNAT